MKLDTAVMLTTAGIFGAEGREPFVSPLARVGGVSLFMRALLTLQRARFSNVFVLSGEELESVQLTLRGDSRITMSLRWLPVREFPPDDPRTWQALGVEVQGACLVMGARAVFGHQLIERLREEIVDSEIALVVRRPSTPERQMNKIPQGINPMAEHRSNRLVALHDWPGEDLKPDAGERQWSVATDMVVLPAAVLAAAGAPATVRKRARLSGAGTRVAGRANASETGNPAGRLLRPMAASVYPIRALLERAATEGTVRLLPSSPGTPHWYCEVIRPTDHKAAERTLLQSLKGDLEGLVDRYFNRKISGFLTRVFLKFGLSANAVTMISMAIGLIAAIFFAEGGYAAGIIGALLFQLSAIVDCCDGEIARLTFTESASGEFIDQLADNVVHTAIFGGIAWAIARQVAEPWVPAVLGTAVIAGVWISFLLVIRVRHLRKTNAWVSQAQAVRSNFILRYVASRDFTVIVLMFALFNRLDWFLWLAAIGLNVFWIVVAWMIRPSPEPRRA